MDVVNIRGLSFIINKAPSTIRRYEREGIFPSAIFTYRGRRYYPVALARSVAPLVSKIPLHRKVDAELVVEINKLFKEERSKYAID